MNSSTLMSIDDVAAALRVSPHTVRRWAGRKLPRIKLGSRTLFDPADVSNFVKQAKKRAVKAEQSSDGSETV